MRRLIDADELIDVLSRVPYQDELSVDAVRLAVDLAMKVDAISVVRCKDCKHRPYEDTYGNPVFPDDVCPCQCSEDPYYGWNPPADWFCPKGEKVTE